MPLLTSLVSYYKLDETTSTRSDSVGGRNLSDNGSVGNAAGALNNSALFNGTAKALEYGSSSDFSFGTSDSSWSGWVQLTTKTTTQSILTSGNFSLNYNQTLNRFVGQMTLTTGVQSVNADALGSPSTGVWYHVVLRHTGTTFRITINASSTNSTTLSFNPTTDPNVFWLGNSTTNFFDGKVDEVGFWQKYLSDAEVTELYGGGTPPAFETFTAGQAYIRSMLAPWIGGASNPVVSSVSLSGLIICRSTFDGKLGISRSIAGSFRGVGTFNGSLTADSIRGNILGRATFSATLNVQGDDSLAGYMLCESLFGGNLRVSKSLGGEVDVDSLFGGLLSVSGSGIFHDPIYQLGNYNVESILDIRLTWDITDPDEGISLQQDIGDVQPEYTFESGVGDDRHNLGWYSDFELDANSTYELDLFDLPVNIFGMIMGRSFTNIKSITIENMSPSSYLTLGTSGVSNSVNWLGYSCEIGYSGIFEATSVRGYDIDSTHRIIGITNPFGAKIPVKVLILGDLVP